MERVSQPASHLPTRANPCSQDPRHPWSLNGPRIARATEGRGLEPRSALARRFSRPLPYQLGLALPIR